jgi:MGT family glycosyltransferase
MRKGLLFGVPSVSVSKTLHPVVRELARSGYQIVTYNVDGLAPQSGHNGITFKPYPACYDIGRVARQMSYFDLVEMLLDTALGLREFLRLEVGTERPDFILHSHLAPWGKAVSVGYGLPAVALHSTFVLDPKVMLPFFRSQRSEGSAVRGDMRQFIRCQRKYRILYADFPGRRRAPDIWDAYVNKESLNLVFVQKDLQEQADTFGSEYQFVGHPTRAMPRSGQRDLIYMSLGTILTDDVELLRLSVRVFGRLKHPCLISLGNKLKPEALGPIPEHVSVADFVDQEDVLGDAALFITMGGMASVQEAIAAEAPMIVIPETPEQHITARRIEQMGIATGLNRRHLTEERLLGAIEHVLSHSQTYRNNIRALKGRHACGDAARLARMHIDAFLSSVRARRDADTTVRGG